MSMHVAPCPGCGATAGGPWTSPITGRSYAARVDHLSAHCPVYLGPKDRHAGVAHLLALPSESFQREVTPCGSTEAAAAGSSAVSAGRPTPPPPGPVLPWWERLAADRDARYPGGIPAGDLLAALDWMERRRAELEARP